MRKISEFLWGLLFLTSSIWICVVSIWKFLVASAYMQAPLFDSFEILLLSINLISVLVFIGASIYSFYLQKTDTSGEKTNFIWIKIALPLFLAWSAYNIYDSLDKIINWTLLFLL